MTRRQEEFDGGGSQSGILAIQVKGNPRNSRRGFAYHVGTWQVTRHSMETDLGFGFPRGFPRHYSSKTLSQIMGMTVTVASIY